MVIFKFIVMMVCGDQILFKREEMYMEYNQHILIMKWELMKTKNE